MTKQSHFAVIVRNGLNYKDFSEIYVVLGLDSAGRNCDPTPHARRFCGRQTSSSAVRSQFTFGKSRSNGTCEKNFIYAKRTHFAVTKRGDNTYKEYLGCFGLSVQNFVLKLSKLLSFSYSTRFDGA